MSGITLDRSHQLGDKIVTLFELNVDVGKSILAVVTQPDDTVVDARSYEDEQQHYGRNDYCNHNIMFLM